jgi:hypothetical protein
MIKADIQEVENILNRRPKGHYWIVIHHRPTKMKLDTGEYVLMRLVKDYDKKPTSQLGTIILEIKDGERINLEINIHDMPINFDQLSPHLGLQRNSFVQEGRSNISGAYLYNQN